MFLFLFLIKLKRKGARINIRERKNYAEICKKIMEEQLEERKKNN